MSKNKQEKAYSKAVHDIADNYTEYGAKMMKSYDEVEVSLDTFYSNVKELIKDAYSLAKERLWQIYNASVNEAFKKCYGKKEDERMIMVWRFKDAPEKYRRYSTHDGDEDWVAFIPEEIKDEYIGWAETGTPFGIFRVSEYEVEGGVIRIGTHA